MSPAGGVLGSFRDPAGFVFRRDGVLYRQVQQAYRDRYDHLMQSGLYSALVGAGLMIPHEEVAVAPARVEQAYRVLRPEPLTFVSYPYEWCPGQLRDAGLATLAIEKMALEFGMTLRDASAFNIQFHRGRPVLIDTLSFGAYQEGKPWSAYRQYCQHFLAPLALAAWADVRLSQLLRIHIDGIPLDLTSHLLPASTRLRPGLLTHIHLHASWQARHAADTALGDSRRMSRMSFLGLIDHLESTTRSLRLKPAGTPWADYYDNTNYSAAALEHKRETVARMLERADPRSVWDLGANSGVFSRLASRRGIPTLAFDLDPAAV